MPNAHSRLTFRKSRWERAPQTFGLTVSSGRFRRSIWIYLGRTSYGVEIGHGN